MGLRNVWKESMNKRREKRKTPTHIALTKYAPVGLQKSLKLRVVDAGDDEALMAELYSLQGPAYSLQSYGIDIVASPKHADGIVVIGAIAPNMQQATLDAYNVISEPKVVIALGDKAIHGDPRFTNCISVKELLGKVDLEIPGNPPTAQNILSYIGSFIKKA